MQMPFDMMVAHVDETSASGATIEESDTRQQEVWESIQDHISPDQFLYLKIEDVYSVNQCGSSDARSRLDRRKQLHSLIQVGKAPSQSPLLPCPWIQVRSTLHKPTNI